MIRVFKHDQGRKTESLKRLLLQYIQKNELKKGDKLPSQSVLRQQLGLSGTTVIRAIRSLVEENILEVSFQPIFEVTNQSTSLFLKICGSAAL